MGDASVKGGATHDWGAIEAAIEAHRPSFKDSGHEYRDRHGVILPSVTQILDVVLPPNPARKFWTERHRRKGSVIHAVTALDDRGVLDEDSVATAIAGRLKGWRGFRSKFANIFEPKLIEVLLQSELGGYAGTADRFGLWHGKVCVLDIKSYLDKMYARLQCAAYAQAFEEITHVPVEVHIAVGLSDNGTNDPLILTGDQCKADREGWFGALAYYHWLQLFPRRKDGKTT